jgi:hypothetical protein
MKWARTVARIIVHTPEGKMSIGTYGHRWKETTERNLNAIRVENVDWLRIGTNGWMV